MTGRQQSSRGRSMPAEGMIGSMAPVVRDRLAERMTIERFEEGQLVIGEEDKGRDLYFILEGAARSAVFTRNGREVAFNDLSAGDCFGELGAIDGLPRSASVVAVRSLTAGRLSGAQFEALLSEEPAFARAILRVLTEKVRALSQKITEYTELTSAQRVRMELMRLARAARIEPDIAVIANPPTQTELSIRIFARREAVAREMARLQRDDLIRRDRQSLTVPSLRRLEAEIQSRSGE